jgi:hypothetical protein
LTNSYARPTKSKKSWIVLAILKAAVVSKRVQNFSKRKATPPPRKPGCRS